jgi:hypothetical protein
MMLLLRQIKKGTNMSLIKYTPYDGYHVGEIDSCSVNPSDIVEVTPLHASCSAIRLRNGRRIESATSASEINRRIHIAEHPIRVDEDIWQRRWQYLQRVLSVTNKLADDDADTIDNDQGRHVMEIILQQMRDIEEMAPDDIPHFKA